MKKQSTSRYRDFAALEARRFQAARLFAQGWRQAVVARELGVTPPSVWRWHKAWQKGGRRALKAAGRAGRKSRLTKAQLGQLIRELLKGPQAHGYATDLWTLPRIAQVIKKHFGIRYHPGYLWWLLRRLEWTPQRPARRAKERDEAAVAQWLRERWPTLKKRANAGVPPSFSPMKAGSPSAPAFGAPGPPEAKPLS